MSSFDYFRKQQEDNNTQNSSSRVPSRPQGWAISLKHNAQDGSTSLSLNLRNIQSVDKDYENVPVDSFEFVVMTAMQMVSANAQSLGFNRVTSNATNKGYFDIAGFDENRTRKDLGLYSSKSMRADKRFWTHPRLYGILRAVNDQNPTAIPQLNQYFGQGALPVVMDLTFDKQNKLMEVIHASRYDLEALVGKSIKVTSSKTAGTVNHHGRNYYQPQFDVTTLTSEEEDKMNSYAKQPIDQLMAFNKAVNKQDDLLAYIFESGLQGENAAQLLDELSDANITTKESATDFINQHGGWVAYTGQQPTTGMPSATPTPQAAPTVAPQTASQTAPQPEPAPAPQATQAPASNDTKMEKLNDDALPF